MADLSRFLVTPAMSIREVMAGIGSALGLALVVDEDRHLLGTVTDGDIRRAILADIDLDQPVEVLLHQGKPPRRRMPVTAAFGTSEARLLQMMTESTLRHIPLVNEAGQVKGVATLDDLAKDFELPLTAVVMAGGSGTRLRPLTDDRPKPMLPMGDRPLLEHIVDRLRMAGIRRLNITRHYKGNVIEDHFGDGRDFGVDIRYVDEKKPLGTAGALSLMEASDEPLLVINGDIVTNVDLRAMLDFHGEHRADMTVAVRQQEFTIPYGVVEMDGVELVGILEKPTDRHMINAGIYLLSAGVSRQVPAGQHYDMTDLIQDLISKGLTVIGFPIQEYWIDIGQPEDYQKAQADVEREKTKR